MQKHSLMKVVSLVLAIFGLAFLSSCDKENTKDCSGENPTIISLTSDKEEIKFGATEPAIIKCETPPDENLTYVWDVDFGDLFVINSDGSEVQFTASPCCMGEKIISCEVSNGHCKTTESIIITIIE